MEEIFNRTQRLLGSDAMAALQSSRVILFGVGGVGSWCAESLVRSGVCHLTIVDADTVSVTNINRQILATTQTVGQVKAEAMRERLLTINPSADITAIHATYTEECNADFHLEQYDYIIDCIDSLKDKIHLLMNATRVEHARVFSSMGAALKIDPTQIKVGEFWKVRGCTLGAAMRKRMRRHNLTLAQKVMCVYSEELLENRGETDETCDYKAVINGSLSHITGIFGLTIAGLVMQDICRKIR